MFSLRFYDIDEIFADVGPSFIHYKCGRLEVTKREVRGREAGRVGGQYSRPGAQVSKVNYALMVETKPLLRRARVGSQEVDRESIFNRKVDQQIRRSKFTTTVARLFSHEANAVRLRILPGTIGIDGGSCFSCQVVKSS